MITGSNGLLGQKIVHALAGNPAVRLVATSQGENRITGKEGYEYRSLDITDRKAVEEIIRDVRPDVLIHTAAMTNVDACETNREACWDVNVNAVEYLIEACKPLGTHFIHLSTDFVFDGQNGPYREEDAVNPLSHYAASKVASEKLVSASGLPWAIIRTIIIYGVCEGMSRSNIVLWVKGALAKGEPLNIVNDQYRMPTLAEDLAVACISAGMKKATGIFHVSGNEMMNMVQLAKKVAHFFEEDELLIREITSDSLNQAAKRPPKTGFVLTKAMEQLDYKPTSFAKGLALLAEQLKELEQV
ncbi:MAG: SDR family oxidoreductase [Flavobacteriales bacterium]|nr:SDR family oxidoreductase [Flavobacteriales bacterium]